MWRQALATENEVARFGDANPVAMEGVLDAPETQERAPNAGSPGPVVILTLLTTAPRTARALRSPLLALSRPVTDDVHSSGVQATSDAWNAWNEGAISVNRPRPVQRSTAVSGVAKKL